jgi:hypothetical protein
MSSETQQRAARTHVNTSEAMEVRFGLSSASGSTNAPRSDASGYPKARCVRWHGQPRRGHVAWERRQPRRGYAVDPRANRARRSQATSRARYWPRAAQATVGKPAARAPGPDRARVGASRATLGLRRGHSACVGTRLGTVCHAGLRRGTARAPDHAKARRVGPSCTREGDARGPGVARYGHAPGGRATRGTTTAPGKREGAKPRARAGECARGGVRPRRAGGTTAVRNTVDYSGHEKLFGKTPTCGPSGPLRRTVRDIRVTLGQEHCINASQHCGLSDGEASTVRDQARTIRPQARTVRSVKNRKTRR